MARLVVSERSVPLFPEGRVLISRDSAGALPRRRRDTGECGRRVGGGVSGQAMYCC